MHFFVDLNLNQRWPSSSHPFIYILIKHRSPDNQNYLKLPENLVEQVYKSQIFTWFQVFCLSQNTWNQEKKVKILMPDTYASPGLISFPQVNFNMIDVMQKRCDFEDFKAS